MEFTIKGRLPNMNEIIEASKSHWSVYAEMKKTYTQLVQLSCAKLPKLKSTSFIITWYCTNRKTDKDGIMAGTKFILDGLVEAGKLENDGWKQIGHIQHQFKVDKENPRVEVKLVGYVQ